jgi:hypothetical protein
VAQSPYHDLMTNNLFDPIHIFFAVNKLINDLFPSDSEFLPLVNLLLGHLPLVDVHFLIELLDFVLVFLHYEVAVECFDLTNFCYFGRKLYVFFDVVYWSGVSRRYLQKLRKCLFIEFI